MPQIGAFHIRDTIRVNPNLEGVIGVISLRIDNDGALKLNHIVGNTRR